MSPPSIPVTARELHHALLMHYTRGEGPVAVVTLLIRLLVEVEALREALCQPETPEAVRRSYREAYERVAVLSHNSAGISGGFEKILGGFVTNESPPPPFASERMMMERLGLSEEEQREVCARMEQAETYT